MIGKPGAPEHVEFWSEPIPPAEILLNEELLKFLIMRDGFPLWANRFISLPDSALEGLAGDDATLVDSESYVSALMHSESSTPSPNRRTRRSKTPASPSASRSATGSFMIGSTSRVPSNRSLRAKRRAKALYLAPYSAEQRTRAQTQTDWLLPSSKLLDPYQYVNLMCWVVNENSGETEERCIALCLRWSGAIVLYDHKAVLADAVGLEYDEEIWRQDHIGEWKRVYWHECLFVSNAGVIVLKTANADDSAGAA